MAAVLANLHVMPYRSARDTDNDEQSSDWPTSHACITGCTITGSKFGTSDWLQLQDDIPYIIVPNLQLSVRQAKQHDWMAKENDLRHRSTATLPDGLQLLPLCLQSGSQLLSCHVATLLYETLRCCFPFCLHKASHT